MRDLQNVARKIVGGLGTNSEDYHSLCMDAVFELAEAVLRFKRMEEYILRTTPHDIHTEAAKYCALYHQEEALRIELSNVVRDVAKLLEDSIVGGQEWNEGRQEEHAHFVLPVAAKLRVALNEKSDGIQT